ncbi:unnamed protein product [Arctia plantaginis]|uniref:Uncharacterized protein n=1 Tax=Arctia plantaginis TaxID=874455 RepID=A0A8S1BK17_ARCPL|nr:unnamed protein product [Arctia plantaginis]
MTHVASESRTRANTKPKCDTSRSTATTATPTSATTNRSMPRSKRLYKAYGLYLKKLFYAKHEKRIEQKPVFNYHCGSGRLTKTSSPDCLITGSGRSGSRGFPPACSTRNRSTLNTARRDRRTPLHHTLQQQQQHQQMQQQHQQHQLTQHVISPQLHQQQLNQIKLSNHPFSQPTESGYTLIHLREQSNAKLKVQLPQHTVVRPNQTKDLYLKKLSYPSAKIFTTSPTHTKIKKVVVQPNNASIWRSEESISAALLTKTFVNDN